MTLSKKFAIYSLLSILLIGAGTWFVVQRAVRDQVYSEYRADALAAQRAVSHHLTAADFDSASMKLSEPDFREMVKNDIAADHFAFINIWARDGTILFSTDRKLIGDRLKLDKHMRQALAGTVVSEQTQGRVNKHKINMPDPEIDSYLETYAPIKKGGKIVGVFETYCDLTMVQVRSAQLNRQAITLLGGSLALLWLVLSGVVGRASRTIDKQNQDLHALTDTQAQSLIEIEDNYLGTLKSLAAAVEARCSYTSGHSQRTRYLSLKLGKNLGLTTEQLKTLGPAAMIHDIGKIGTPEAILDKVAALTTDEWETMKLHPEVGAQIVAAVPFLAHLAPIVRGHHENYDGTGYPEGLAGDEIPIEARVMAVADAFDAITSNRSYRGGVSAEKALARLEASSGVRFDPVVTAAFVDMCRDDISGGGDIQRLYGPQYVRPRLMRLKTPV